MATTDAVSRTAEDTAFFGHPRGLSTLFFTEMWERFSYYGVRSLLLLYMAATAEQHGLGLGVVAAGAIYGLYTSCAYIFALPAGWIADRFLGHQNAVIVGGILIAAGNFGLMLPTAGSFVLSLLVMAIGTSFLKTSCTTVVGFLYPQGDSRRDSGFTVYYMGINLGAFLAPLTVGSLGQKVDFRYAFGTAGLFMLVGLVQFVMTRSHLGTSSRTAAVAATGRDRQILVSGCVAFLVLLGALYFLQPSEETIANGFAVVLLTAVAATFAGLLLSKDFSTVERRRIYVILICCMASALFWSIVEQAGSTLTLFADRSTRNSLLGWDFPSTWFQSLNPAFIWALGPIFAWLWVKLRHRDPAPVTKFAFGLLGAGGGFLVFMLAVQAAGPDGKVSPLWLTSVYMLHTIGELCLSPVGLSAMTKLAPARIAGMIMGVWFLSISVGNFFAGRMASFYETMPVDTLVGYAGGAGVAFGALLLLISKRVTGLMGGVK